MSFWFSPQPWHCPCTYHAAPLLQWTFTWVLCQYVEVSVVVVIVLVVSLCWSYPGQSQCCPVNSPSPCCFALVRPMYNGQPYCSSWSVKSNSTLTHLRLIEPTITCLLTRGEWVRGSCLRFFSALLIRLSGQCMCLLCKQEKGRVGEEESSSK